MHMAETKMELAEWLDDLCVRFILNLPQEELESVERICFQVEEAQWYYEDFVRPLDPSLPSMNLRQFCLLLFQVCPFLSGYTIDQHLSAYSQFLAYKTRVPVRGVIMLNDAMDEVVLVKGYKKGANWSFPRGKINKDEADLDCAIREAYEETGFNLSDAGLIPDESQQKFIEVTMREQHMKLFVFRNVPKDTYFHPRTRKEISKIGWWKLATLPGYQKKRKHGAEHEEGLSANKLYMVAPFLPPLKKWIAQQRKVDVQASVEASGSAYLSTADGMGTDGEVLGEEELPLDALPRQQQFYDSWQPTTTAEMGHSSNIQPELDAAAQMKKLLGVNQQPPQAQPPSFQQPFQAPQLPSDERSGNLLALLKSNGKASGSSAFHPPQTPADQIGFPLQEPRSPTHHHQPHQTHVGGNGPPPSFPSLADQRQPNTQVRHQPQKSSFGGYGPNGMYSSEQIFGASGMPDLRQPTQYPSAAGQGRFPASDLASQFDRDDAAPYLRTGDPSFARPQGTQGPTAPAASQLPAPKLSNHAMGLLSMFKGSSEQKAAAPAPASTPTPARQAAALAPIGTPPAPSAAQSSKPKPPSRSNSLQAFAGLIPSNVTPVSRRDSAASSRQAPKAKPASQQDTLLNLFKSGDSQTQSSKHVVITRGTTQPAELSALATPGPATFPMASQPIVVKKASDPVREAPRTVSKILQRPSSSHKVSPAPVEAPTVRTPKAVPQEFEASSSKKRQPAARQTPKKNAKPRSPAITPMQILKRPTEPAKEPVTKEPAATSALSVSPPSATSPAKAARTPAVAAELEATQNKPFQPQILRRPRPDSRPSSSGGQEPSERKAAPGDERKQSLLNLFQAKPQPITVETNAASPPKSPPKSANVSGTTSPPSELSRSLINSVSTAAVEPSSSRMSRQGSVQSGAASHGPSSPSVMSAADRGFLMNYLENVVKGQKR